MLTSMFSKILDKKISLDSDSKRLLYYLCC